MFGRMRPIGDIQRRFEMGATADQLPPDGKRHERRKAAAGKAFCQLAVHLPFTAGADMADTGPICGLEGGYFANNADTFDEELGEFFIDFINFGA